MKKQNIFSTIIAIVLFMSGGTYIYNQYNNDYIFNWSFTDQDEKIDISYSLQKYSDENLFIDNDRWCHINLFDIKQITYGKKTLFENKEIEKVQKKNTTPLAEKFEKKKAKEHIIFGKEEKKQQIMKM